MFYSIVTWTSILPDDIRTLVLNKYNEVAPDDSQPISAQWKKLPSLDNQSSDDLSNYHTVCRAWNDEDSARAWVDFCETVTSHFVKGTVTNTFAENDVPIISY
jgi:hypothetical protein